MFKSYAIGKNRSYTEKNRMLSTHFVMIKFNHSQSNHVKKDMKLVILLVQVSIKESVEFN